MGLHTPFFELHRSLNARMVDFAGWDMPIQYRGIVDEHNAVRQNQGAFDISHMGRLRFVGDRAAAMLSRLVTCDVLGLEKGQIRYGLVLNHQGFALDDILAYRLQKDHYLVVNASNREKILAWIASEFANEGVACVDETLGSAMVAVQGPNAVATCSRIAGQDFSSLGYYRCAEITWKGSPVIVSRTGYTGEDGMEWSLPAALAPVFAEELGKAGVSWSGLGARDTLRLEAAMPLYGHELDEATDPLQAGLAFAVRKTQADFVGADALAKRATDRQGPVRIGLRLAGKRIARQGDRVLDGATEVGQVTSGTFGPTVGYSLAMAMVEPGHKTIGQRLEIDVRGKPEQAEVVKLPFYKRPTTRV